MDDTDSGGSCNSNGKLNWRDSLPQPVRSRMVKHIVDYLHKVMPVNGLEDERKLVTSVCRFENNQFQSATDLKDYLRKIASKLLTIEHRSRNPPGGGMVNQDGQSASMTQSSLTGGSIRKSSGVGSFTDPMTGASDNKRQQWSILQQQPVLHRHQDYSRLQTGVPALGAAPASLGSSGHSASDQRHAVWAGLQVLRERHLRELTKILAGLTRSSCQVQCSERKASQLQGCKKVLQRMISYLTAPKERLPRQFNLHLLEQYEKTLVNILQIFQHTRSGMQGQQSRAKMQKGQIISGRQQQTSLWDEPTQAQPLQEQQQMLYQGEEWQQVQEPQEQLNAQACVSVSLPDSIPSIQATDHCTQQNGEGNNFMWLSNTSISSLIGDGQTGASGFLKQQQNKYKSAKYQEQSKQRKCSQNQHQPIQQQQPVSHLQLQAQHLRHVSHSVDLKAKQEQQRTKQMMQEKSQPQRHLQRQQQFKLNSPELVSSPQTLQPPSLQGPLSSSPQTGQQGSETSPVHAATLPCGASSPMLAGAPPSPPAQEFDAAQLPLPAVSPSQTILAEEAPAGDKIACQAHKMAVECLATKVKSVTPSAGNCLRPAIEEGCVAVTTTGLQANTEIHDSRKRRRSVESGCLNEETSGDGTLWNNTLNTPYGLEFPKVAHRVTKPRGRCCGQINIMLHLELAKLNRRFGDSFLEVSEKATKAAAADSKNGIKDGVVVLGIFKGKFVEPQRTHIFNLSHNIPLFILVPPSYPEEPPVIWPDSIPEDM